MTSNTSAQQFDEDLSSQPQEVEFALILARMIETVKSDPEQMRVVVYEFARSRLRQMSSGDPADGERMMKVLETAIRGVEDFNLKHEALPQLQKPAPDVPSGRSTAVLVPAPQPPVVIEQATPLRSPGMRFGAARMPPVQPPKVNRGMRARIAGFIVVVILAAAVMKQTNLFPAGNRLIETAGQKVAESIRSQEPSSSATKPTAAGDETSGPAGSAASAQSTVSGAQFDSRFFNPNVPAANAAFRPASAPSKSMPSGPSGTIPLPPTYGVYAVNNGKLTRLNPLPDYIPDKKIAISTPLERPATTLLPDGNLKFVIYHRDMALSPPDVVDVRVFARIARATTFDAKGKLIVAPVHGLWSLRNISYEFRIASVMENSEMRVFQGGAADFSLGAGRYVLVFDGRGYDFMVGGSNLNRNQCLERLDAANGSFYSECQEPAQ